MKARSFGSRTTAGANTTPPYTLCIEIETEEEARAIYAIFNYIKSVKLIGDDVARNVKAAIGYDWYVSSGHIANGITCEEYYE